MRRALCLLGLLVLATPAAALMLEVPFDRLARDSDEIVRVKVIGLESRWTDDRATIVTDVTLAVVETWAGDLTPGNSIVLQVQGGEVGEMGIRAEHQPVFAMGEEAVIFLKATPSARWRVYGLEQGKYTVLEDQTVGFRRQRLSLASLRATVAGFRPARNR